MIVTFDELRQISRRKSRAVPNYARTAKQMIMAANRRNDRFKVLTLDQLRGLPRVCYGIREPAVYFLWEGPQLIYIGQSEKVCDRVAQHMYCGRVFTHATYEATHRTCLRFNEGQYIWRYNPTFNHRGRAWR